MVARCYSTCGAGSALRLSQPRLAWLFASNGDWSCWIDPDDALSYPCAWFLQPERGGWPFRYYPRACSSPRYSARRNYRRPWSGNHAAPIGEGCSGFAARSATRSSFQRRRYVRWRPCPLDAWRFRPWPARTQFCRIPLVAVTHDRRSIDTGVVFAVERFPDNRSAAPRKYYYIMWLSFFVRRACNDIGFAHGRSRRRSRLNRRKPCNARGDGLRMLAKAQRYRSLSACF